MKIILGAALIFGAAWLMVYLQAGSGSSDSSFDESTDNGNNRCQGTSESVHYDGNPDPPGETRGEY